MSVTLHTPPAADLKVAEIARWAPVPTAVAVDLIRGAGQIDPAIRPLRPAGIQPRLFGQAVTVRCEAPDFGAVLHALDVIERGQVLVIAAGGHRDTAMIGDIMAGHLRNKGVAGLICDGAVRDTGTLGGWDDFPVFSRWITPRGPIGADLGAAKRCCWDQILDDDLGGAVCHRQVGGSDITAVGTLLSARGALGAVVEHDLADPAFGHIDPLNHDIVLRVVVDDHADIAA